MEIRTYVHPLNPNMAISADMDYLRWKRTQISTINTDYLSYKNGKQIHTHEFTVQVNQLYLIAYDIVLGTILLKDIFHKIPMEAFTKANTSILVKDTDIQNPFNETVQLRLESKPPHSEISIEKNSNLNVLWLNIGFWTPQSKLEEPLLDKNGRL